MLALELPVVQFSDFSRTMLREHTTPVVKDLAYTFAHQFRLMPDGSVTSITNGLLLAVDREGTLAFVPQVPLLALSANVRRDEYPY